MYILMGKTRYPIVIERERIDEFRILAIEGAISERKKIHGVIQNELNEALKNHIKAMKERCGNGPDRLGVRA